MGYSKFIVNKKQILENLDNLNYDNICAMVKANAYGLGLKPICKILFGKVNFFGVANMQEALKIRAFDKKTAVLVVGITENFKQAIKKNISITIDNIYQFERLEKYLINKNVFIKIHIKINSGMNRLGINQKIIFADILKRIQTNKKIILEGIFTHFSTIIEDERFLLKQMTTFVNFINLIPNNFTPIIHIGGGQILRKIKSEVIKKLFKNCMIRVGIDLYKNSITIESKIIKIHNLKKFDRVGYSNGFICKKNTKVAIVPLGYADGINKKLSGKCFVFIDNIPCKIIGNICMDMLFVDVSDKNCKVGDKIVILKNENYWAKIIKTIPYEILTNLNYTRLDYKISN